jgi:hypothetical protein
VQSASYDRLSSLEETLPELNSPENAVILAGAFDQAKNRPNPPQTIHELFQELGIPLQ